MSALAKVGPATAAVLLAGLMLAGCTAIPDSAKPEALYGGTPAPASPEAAFPDLRSVPAKAPQTTPPAEQQRIADGLADDGADAARDSEHPAALDRDPERRAPLPAHGQELEGTDAQVRTAADERARPEHRSRAESECCSWLTVTSVADWRHDASRRRFAPPQYEEVRRHLIMRNSPKGCVSKNRRPFTNALHRWQLARQLRTGAGLTE